MAGRIGVASASRIDCAAAVGIGLFLLPSAQESFGLAALEAMACEVPVVASRVGGLHEVVEHGVNGFLHDLDDIDGMAESGIELLTDADPASSRSGPAGRDGEVLLRSRGPEVRGVLESLCRQ